MGLLIALNHGNELTIGLMQNTPHLPLFNPCSIWAIQGFMPTLRLRELSDKHWPLSGLDLTTPQKIHETP